VAELRKEEMLSLCEKAVRTAERSGASEVEAYICQILRTSVGIERGQIVKTITHVDQGLGVRATYNKAIGFAYTNLLTEKTVEEAASKAFSSAKASQPDPYWRSFTTRKCFANVQKTFDKKILELSSEELVGLATRMLQTATEKDKRVFVVDGEVEASYAAKALFNSYDVSNYDKGTFISCGLAAVAREANYVTPVCFEFDAKRTLDIDPEWVGSETARLTASALKAEPIPSKTYTVVFTQLAMQLLLSYTLVNAVKADYVQREQSALKGKIGEKVASENVSIYDDGILEGGFRTWGFDDEGVDRRKTVVIEKGVLKNFLYDNYTAGKDEVESTGNAYRGGNAPYVETPSIEATNFQFTPGNKSTDELISEIDSGLIVYFLQGAHSSNPVSGEFSVVAVPSWKIEKGEIKNAVKGAMLSGTVFDVLRNVSALANNQRQVGALVAPWISVENVKVIGK
jgi:PmbA protein